MYAKWKSGKPGEAVIVIKLEKEIKLINLRARLYLTS